VERGRGAADLADLAPLNALGNPVRRRLYEYVSDAGRAVGRDEAAGAAGVSRSLAAYHLDTLVERGLLEACFARPRDRGGPGAGRPPKLYLRAGRDFALRLPARDYELLGELLVRAARTDDSGAVRAALERVAYDFGRSVGDGASAELETVLRQRGYEPYRDECGALRLRNCPFGTVARRDPELVCTLNTHVLKGLCERLDDDAVADLEPRPGHCCVAIRTVSAAELRSDLVR
jgi:predicted ArsR family transcriptional regulator